MAQTSNLLLRLFLILVYLQHAIAAGLVCSSGVYSLFAPLSSNTVVQQYCTSKFPVYTTSTATVVSVVGSTSTATVTTTVTVDPAPAGKRAVSSASKAASPAPTTLKTSTTKAANQVASALISLFLSQASATISTFCSCIEVPQIKTSLVPTTTTTVSTATVTVTANTVPPVCLSPGSNIVANGGFESGDLTGWSSNCGGSVTSPGDSSNSAYQFVGKTRYCDLTQVLNVVPGILYTVNYRYMISDNPSSNIDPAVNDANGQYLADRQTITANQATNVWASGKSFSFTSSTTTVTLDVGVLGPQTFWLDNIVVSC